MNMLTPQAVPLMMANGALFDQRLPELHPLLLSAENSRAGTFLTPFSAGQESISPPAHTYHSCRLHFP